ncbi:MAG: family 16 glycosylhydrolase [Candidatus Omnitrophica bacterium]|nr:family 16 glycosylhydrolase [Candidatus Omnitrophota bacterium]
MRSAIAPVLLLCLLFLPAAEAASGKTVPPKLDGWYLVWHDEFDGDKVDPAKWRVEDAALVKNKELEYYSPWNVYIKDGKLILKSEKKERGGRPYTSGLVETKGRYSFEYGRVEVRAKLPGTKGMWPAHWMMPAKGGWPPEIDIMELVGSKPNVIHMTNHYGEFPRNRYDSKVFTGPDYTKGFHVFALEWEEGELRWYIDGVRHFSVTRNVPHGPFYIILNTAVGGTMPSNPDETTVFPQYHEIDYVRVYMKEIPGTYFLMTSAVNGKIAVEPRLPRYKKGDKVKVTAVPGIGYKFVSWNGDANLGNDSSGTILMNRHKTITANFTPDPNAPKLLSRGKKAVASTAEGPELSAGNAVDGDMGTRWSSEFFDPQWIYIDLGKPRVIEAVRLEWENASARAFKLQVSDDARRWRTVYSTDNGAGGTEEITGLDVTGRYVRVYGSERRSKYGFSLWEFEVFGKEPPSVM